ncbi:hypothetical protein OG739_35480 [Streptomyces longwoodensis]|uniref:hypothetical protein n=1 Tax=Streptomyces longwoodensis TaxID=68231 RepID=UPI00324567E0
MLDSQTIKTSADVPRKDQGTEAVKRTTGRKAAGVSDTAAGATLLSRVAAAAGASGPSLCAC